MTRLKMMTSALVALLLGAGQVSAEITRTLQDGKYWIDVPQGETHTLDAQDVAALMPESGEEPDLYKIGEGTLNMLTNAETEVFMNYNGDIHVTNGLLKVLSEYGLGNYDNGGARAGGVTYVWPGAAFDNAYQRVENNNASLGVTQRETIHVAGTGYGDYGALNETVGNHIMLGRITLEDDATFCGPVSANKLHLRYHLLDFKGHQMSVATNRNVGFGSLSVTNVPAVPIVVGNNATLTFTGSGITTMGSGPVIQMGNATTLGMDGVNTDGLRWGLEFVSNGTFYAYNVSSRAGALTNCWNGPVVLKPGCTLSVRFSKSTLSCGFAREVLGGGNVSVDYDGTLELGAARHCIRELRLSGTGRKLRLPADFVLEVQSLKANGSDMPEGDYTSANLANILSGTVRVNRQAFVYSSSPISYADYSVVGYASRQSAALSDPATGPCTVVATGDTALLTTFTGLTDLIGRARFHVDATALETFTFVSEGTWLSTNGLRGISRWNNINGNNLYFSNFTLTGEFSQTKQAYHRYVSAYPTLQDYTVNGVTRPYVDLGEFSGQMDTRENYYDNSFSTSPTAAGMVPNNLDGLGGNKATLAGLEYHLVFGDAHPNPTNENRGALLGRTNCGVNGKPEYLPGRRGLDGKLFAQKDLVTDSFRDGRIWADNAVTNSTYVPDWGEVHVYTLIPTNAFMGTDHKDFVGIGTLGVDSYARYGGTRYGEILVYDLATNSAVNRARIDAYLMKKWVGRGRGPEMVFDTVELRDNATLTLANEDYADIGICYRIGTVKGTGSLAVGTNDTLFLDNLSPEFSQPAVCDCVTTEAPVTFSDSGTVLLTRADGVQSPKAGRYRILAAPRATNPEALDHWTIESGDALVKLQRDGTTLYAEVFPRGLTVIFR